MQFQWSYTGCSKSDEERIAAAWRERQAEIESKAGLLEGSDSSHARLHMERSDSGPPWIVQAALYATPHTIAAEGEGAEIEAALDHLVEQVSQQIDQRAGDSQEVERRPRDLAGVVSFLDVFRRSGHSRGFLFFLMPIVNAHRRYAQRELRARRELDEIPAGEATARDVLDEALLRAWERFGQRPQATPLDVWLLRLVDEVLEEYAQPIAQESLEAPRRMDDMQTREELLNEWTEIETEPEWVAWAELLPEEAGAAQWDSLGIEEKQTHLDEIFKRLPRHQRQVLMLAAEGGFNSREIADFQDRAVGQVEADLAAATWALQQLLTTDDLDETTERLEREAMERPRK